MATTTQKQDEDRTRSAQGAATSQGTNQPSAIQRATTSSVERPSRSLGPVISFTPFSMMWRMFAELERMLDPLIAGDADRAGGMLGVAWVPRMDVAQRDGKLVIRVDLPGLAADQVSVVLSGNELVIEGERAAEMSVGAWHSERVYGRFRRVVVLPVDADADAMEARFENGVLQISVPVQGAGVRRIEIRTGDGESQNQAQGQAPGAGGQP